MSNVQKSSSHGKLIAVIVSAAVVIALVLLSAFVWPGWAMNHNGSRDQQAQSSKSQPTTPSIKAKDLPQDASALLKAMPDSVLNFARIDAGPSADWTSASPLEEYTLTYSTGDSAKNVSLKVAQWPSGDGANGQYDALVKALNGEDVASGDVKVSGNATGSYMVKTTDKKGKEATAIWRNDSVVFQATGPKDSVLRFYQKFPL
ncbi:hypothetical protein [Bifidobacterium sp. ESL0790]|uniref:hypothetical protein n=1 Tax=Bifidobacterium sp. ESL0790 TaxID=2983233 RepID=UPI0023F91340|nr:hypothetical protein [Bifidobacterium sp. ESL0790]WEV72067.1 hypothetical protein OZY47_06395 [Bifidobacterium sp. ESL0790]